MEESKNNFSLRSTFYGTIIEKKFQTHLLLIYMQFISQFLNMKII